MALLLARSSLEGVQIHSHFITDNVEVLSYLQPRLPPTEAVRVGVSLADKEGAVPTIMMGCSGLWNGHQEGPDPFPVPLPAGWAQPLPLWRPVSASGKGLAKPAAGWHFQGTQADTVTFVTFCIEKGR